MAIGKFVKKPEQVRALQFIGGPQNGLELVDWVIRQGGQAVWLQAVEAVVEAGVGEVSPARPERLRIITPNDVQTANIGDYILRGEDDVFRILKASVFEARYAPA